MLTLCLFFIVLAILSFAAVVLGVVDLAIKILAMITLVMVGTYLFLGLLGMVLEDGKDKTDGSNS